MTVPKHIAVIMDGNGRWAKKRAMPRSAGHYAGSNTFRTIAKKCNALGVSYFTVYAFSTENWKRPKEEVSYILELLKKYLLEAVDDLIKENIKLKFIGDITPLPDEIKELIKKTDELSEKTTGMQVNIALNYGSRAEIINAAKNIAVDLKNGKINENEINESMFESYLFTKNIPSPDLLIRPGGERRLSNYLLWQLSYAELYFTDVLWPDFKEKHLLLAIEDYNKRNRRYGGI